MNEAFSPHVQDCSAYMLVLIVHLFNSFKSVFNRVCVSIFPPCFMDDLDSIRMGRRALAGAVCLSVSFTDSLSCCKRGKDLEMYVLPLVYDNVYQKRK